MWSSCLPLSLALRNGILSIRRPPAFYSSASPPAPQFQEGSPHPQHICSSGSSPGPGPTVSQGHKSPVAHPGSPGHHPCARWSPPLPPGPPGLGGPHSQAGILVQPEAPLTAPGLCGAYQGPGLTERMANVPGENHRAPSHTQGPSEGPPSAGFEPLQSPAEFYEGCHPHGTAQGLHTPGNSSGEFTSRSSLVLI